MLQGEAIEAWLHPDWVNLRPSRNDGWQAAILEQPLANRLE